MMKDKLCKHRRVLSVIMALTLTVSALAGCGGAQNAGEPAGQGGASPAEAKNQVGSGGDQQPQSRKVKDEYGEVEVPANPKRIAGIYLEDYLMALGITPVVQWYHPLWGKQDYLGLDVPTFDITGSLEAMLEASPDLILLDGAADQAKAEQYAKIAPTYRVPEQVLQDPPKVLATLAEVLGIPDKGAAALNTYNTRMAEAKEKLSKAIGGKTVATVRLNVGDKTLAVFGILNRYTGPALFQELGLTPHPFVKNMKENQAVLSEEKIAELDADYVILFPSNGSWTSSENKEAVNWLESSALWNSLPAVKSGHVLIAERTHWQSGAVTANMKKADDLVKWLVK